MTIPSTSGPHEDFYDPKPIFQIRPADFYSDADALAIVDLIDEYAQTPAGGGEPLDPEVRESMVAGLQTTPGAFAILAWHNDTPVGVAVCLQGFSTFAARPLVNVHDLAVTESYRGQGIGAQLLRAVEAHSRTMGACKVTLEVRTGNPRAEALYRRRGFHDPSDKPTKFLEKLL